MKSSVNTCSECMGRNRTLPFWDNDKQRLPSAPSESPRDKDRQRVSTLPAARPRDAAERRQRDEVRKAAGEGQQSEGERGILMRCHGDAPQGERQTRQALAEEKEGKGTVSQEGPGSWPD